MQNTSKLVKKLGEEITKYQDMIQLEKKVREETQNTLFRMIEDMEANLTREIENERRERSENQESFVTLLEETCSRIERSMIS